MPPEAILAPEPVIEPPAMVDVTPVFAVRTEEIVEDDWSVFKSS
jgi:hypothetical protein